ncbi:TonB-dependent siderophore receptor [Stigmatella sp. ncwal1]|uniref:TonB-dependent siderophore receptor n=1 Tax=Stigmatella ashevillensis TaxID=2995309 RepID=A0ABT5D1M9_9BACT|nr:TonB-dependent siderophore receptor [Stigmatella ashevillena]MDC0707575.1 TonB-dependent siderophore receptor [Stigmatella ashevillena]
MFAQFRCPRGGRFHSLGMFAGVSCLAFATVASAQEEGSAITLETVRVQGEREQATGPIEGYTAERSASGTKTDTELIETPQAISVVGREQMDAQQVQSVVEATRYTPGVRAGTFGADSRNDWFLVRGFTSQDSGYYLDGLQLFSSSFATWRLEPFGLERIEAVRGPSSVLYGGTNPGGLLNLVSKKPSARTLLHLEAGINEFGNGYGAVDVGGSIDQGERWLYRVSALGRGGGTQVEHTNNDRLFLAPSVTWVPAKSTTLTLHGSYLRDRTRGQNFLPYVGTVVDAPYGRIPTDLFTSEPDLDHFKRDQFLVGYEFEHRFSEAWTVRQNLRYGHLKIDFQNYYGVGYAGDPADAQLARGNFVTVPEADLFTVDNQVQARFETGPLVHRVLLGVDYKNYRIADEQGYEAGTPLDLRNPVYGSYAPPESRYTLNETAQNQLGVYLQDQIQLATRWNLVLSGRHDWVSTDLENQILPEASYDGSVKSFSGRAGLIYTFDSGFAPYVSYARSFNPVAGTTAAGELFEPETGQQVEAGLKIQPEGMNSTLGLSVFELRRQNFVTTDGAFNQLQIGEVRSRGAELEVITQLLPGLSVIGTASVYGLEITDGTDFETGKTPVGSPELMASLWVDYTFQQGTLEGLGAGAGIRSVGRSFADRANTLEVPGFTLVDLGLHYQRNHWRAAINVANLLDDEYVSSCSSEAACFYGDQRRAALNVGYTW